MSTEEKRARGGLCVKCGFTNPVEFNFCGKCGNGINIMDCVHWTCDEACISSPSIQTFQPHLYYSEKVGLVGVKCPECDRKTFLYGRISMAVNEWNRYHCSPQPDGFGIKTISPHPYFKFTHVKECWNCQHGDIPHFSMFCNRCGVGIDPFPCVHVSDSGVSESDPVFEKSKTGVKLVCKQCGKSTEEIHSEGSAIDLWNKLPR